MSIKEDEVIWAYRMFLNREPESREVIAAQMKAYGSIDDLRKVFASSGDFKALVREPRNCHIAPFLLPDSKDGRIVIDVPTLAHPGSQMCTYGQTQERYFIEFCQSVGLDPSIAHRKHWEWAYIMRMLEVEGMAQPGKRGLVFAVGKERLPALLASKGADVMATDGPRDVVKIWATSDQYSEEVKSLWYPEITSWKEISNHVTFRVVDMLNIPNDLTGFDFLWSSCALEHLGGIVPGAEFVKKAMSCLKPGGLAVHTTEFNLSSNDETVDEWPTCIYRRQDIERLAADLTRAGHEVYPLNFFPGRDPLDIHIDYPPHSPPHLKLALYQYVTTSFGITVKKSR